jgi:MinD superfamily P-loop ATPase
MKQIAVISGKGGTGKSTLVASLTQLVFSKMIADCDVDAPNLHLLLEEKDQQKWDYSGAKEARINYDLCIKCGVCADTCRYGAISDDIVVNSLKCEGCNACVVACPQDAMYLEEVNTGWTSVSRTEHGTFGHALLDIGAEGSGKLVTEVRKKVIPFDNGEEWLIIDGSPGIGCSVIASITGTDAVIAVTEPTKSGLSDLKRVLDLSKHFDIPAFVCINKFDLNMEITNEMEEYCQENGFDVVGRIPFDPAIVKALQEYKTPVDAGDQAFIDEVNGLWEKVTVKIGQ